MISKTCTKCLTLKPISDFKEVKNKAKASKYGVRSECRDCSNKMRIAYYNKNKEREYAVHLKWVEENRDWYKENYKKNKGKFIQKSKEYYATKRVNLDSFYKKKCPRKIKYS